MTPHAEADLLPEGPMFALFSTRLRRFLLLAVGVPVLGWLLGRAGEAVERRRPGSKTGRALTQTGGWLHRNRRRRPFRPGW
jgi:hypothetical protein